MYIYLKAGHTDTWETGYYLTKYSHDGRPFIQFFCESVWDSPTEAAARVNYLNGGTGTFSETIPDGRGRAVC